MRYIVFDTETTGINVSQDRVFEIGCVEIVNRQKTGRVFNKLINPTMPVSETSKEICQITDEDLVGKPIFASIAEEFLAFLEEDRSSTLIAHNAPFDIKFINNEFAKMDVNPSPLDNFNIIDTLQIARTKFPGSPASLNALSKKFEISLEDRKAKGHGALLDSDILADVFIKMCADDDDQTIVNSNKKEELFFGIFKRSATLESRQFDIEQDDLIAHSKILEKIKSEAW